MRVSNGDPPAMNTTDQQIDPEEENARKILIKLKYLNETQKEVEGSLDELLKDFKWLVKCFKRFYIILENHKIYKKKRFFKLLGRFIKSRL